MIDLIKKTILASLGAAVITRDKVLEALRFLVEQGKMSGAELEKLADELVQSGQTKWDEVQAGFSDTFKKGTGGLNMATKEEIEELKTRLEAIEKRLAKLEGPPS